MTELGTRPPVSGHWYHSADLVALLGVAGLLISVHLWLPDMLVSRFVFTYGDPTPVTAWTSTAIHDSPAHLTSNLAWYGIVIGPAYTVYAIWSRRRLFWLLYGGVLVVTPLSTAAVNYWLLYQRWELVGPESIAFGFSGVVGAFAGLLAVGLAGIVARWYSWLISIATTLTFVVCGLGAAIGRSPLLSQRGELVVGGAFGVAVVGIFFAWRCGWIPLCQWVSAHQETIVIVGGCGILLSALVAGLFTVEGVSAGRFPNVIAHATGFVTGLSIAAGGCRVA